jgi:hypothetical protein
MTVSTTHFVNTLRVRPEIIRLASEQVPVCRRPRYGMPCGLK